MKYDGIFFDSGGTIFSFAAARGDDPTSRDVAAQAPARAAAALRWLGHEVEDDAVAQHLRDLKTAPQTRRPDHTQEKLVEALFTRLELAPRADEIVYVTGVYSGPRYRSWLFPEVAEVLQRLRETGLFIGLIANTDVPGWVMDRNFRGVGLLPFFPLRVYSGDEGVQKPDPRIFALAATRAGLDGKRLVYMGDRVDKDIAGARAAGWDSILFRSSEQSSQGLADYEIDAWNQLEAVLA